MPLFQVYSLSKIGLKFTKTRCTQIIRTPLYLLIVSQRLVTGITVVGMVQSADHILDWLADVLKYSGGKNDQLIANSNVNTTNLSNDYYHDKDRCST